MPRKKRLYIPGIPVHVVQRGHNRNACFFSDDDFLYYKEVLGEGLRRYGAALHAYCLMTNHVHLLMTPFEEDSIQRVVQHLGRQYVQYVNKTYRRSGSLWEGRHKGSLVASDDYLLRCYRYIELNPVTARMVEKPEQYRWSSYHANACEGFDPLLAAHPVYLALDNDASLRCFNYRELFSVSLCDENVHEIREAVAMNRVLGNAHFKAEVEIVTGQKLGYGKAGRPRRERVV